MNENIGHHDEHTTDPAGDQEAMHDQAGLYGFSEADFVREEKAR